MIIALVTEFPQDEYFQWRQAWSIERQLKYHAIVKSVEISPATLHWYGGNFNHPNWHWLRKADVIFCYCSRTSADMYSEGRKWWWYQVPNYLRKIRSSTSKLIVQWDDDLLFLFHPDWVWWNREEKPVEYEGQPERFSEETKLFEVADMYFSVLPNPEFAKYTTKPVKQMLIPHLEKIKKIDFKSTYEHAPCLAMLHHSSKACSNDHSVKNVVSKLGYQTRYFTAATNTKVIPLPYASKIYRNIGREAYFRLLSEQCQFAIDDCEGYMGWSRFPMECAILKIPCVGSFSSNRMIFPDLTTEHKDYKKQIELLKHLNDDKVFRLMQAKQGYENVMKILDSDVLIQTFLEYAKTLNPTESQSTQEEFDTELLIQQLNKILPFHLIPPRPPDGVIVYDHMKCLQMDNKKWDELYAQFGYLINDERKYKAIIKIALDRKNQNQTMKSGANFLI